MNTQAPSYRSDIRPLEFTVTIFLGCLTSFGLSLAHISPLISVAVAALIMAVLAMWRFQIARDNGKDYQSLEAFAEDVYLLGYLLTLSALVGSAPRLMSDEANLFNIAGLKLTTTIIGLSLMMSFRQTARRWAEQEKAEEKQLFLQQQQQFSDAVGRLNTGADALTSKLDEVIHWFDPQLLKPVSDWSNAAADAFAKATTCMQSVPQAMTTCFTQLQSLIDDLAKVKTAACELAGALSDGTIQAANLLSIELNTATRAATTLGSTLIAASPAGEKFSKAVEGLNAQTVNSTTNIQELGDSFHRVVLEIGKVERALKKLADLETEDINQPINRLSQTMQQVGEKASISSERLEHVSLGLRQVSEASKSLEAQIATQVVLAEKKSGQKEIFQVRLWDELNAVRQAMAEINAQLASLGNQMQNTGESATKPSFFRIFGGGK